MRTEHRDTEPTPTSLRRLEQPVNKRQRKYRTWRDDARIKTWCGWRMFVDGNEWQK